MMQLGFQFGVVNALPGEESGQYESCEGYTNAEIERLRPQRLCRGNIPREPSGETDRKIASKLIQP